MWDVFISHAWEDKEDVARPLAKALRQKGLRVWYDEFTLTLGDSLRRSIDRGLAQSRYGVVILSPNFFAKEWPQRELDGLVAKEVSSEKTILPVWHDVTWEDVSHFSPTLADKLAVSTAKGLDVVVEEIMRALHMDSKSEPTQEEHRPERRLMVKKPVKAFVLVRGALLAGGLVLLFIVGTSIVSLIQPRPKPPRPTPTDTQTLITLPLISTPTPIPPMVPVAVQTMVWDKDGSVMVYVPAGKFIMGSSDAQVNSALALGKEYDRNCEQSWFKDEQPQHTVDLDAFYIDRTEVTNAQFAQFLNEQGNQEEGDVTWLNIGDVDCLITQSGGQYQPKSGYEDYPVIEVNWYGARAYCQWAGRRLPTEAEWEKAARGTDGRTYPWGEGIDCEHAQVGILCGGQTVPVGSKPKGASPYGALDMAGNAWEWVYDRYKEDYYSQSPDRNPTGPDLDSGEYRVVRGGRHNKPIYVRSAHRFGMLPANTDTVGGFRCAKSSP